MSYILFHKPRTPLTDNIFKRTGTCNLTLVYWPELSNEEKKIICPQVKYLIVGATPISASFMDEMPSLKMILRFGTGFDNIDLLAAKDRNIAVTNAAGANANSVAEMTIGLILSIYHKISFFDRRLRTGHWDMFTYRSEMFEMNKKVHGIIGMGNIGKRVTKLSQAFGTKVFYWDRNRLNLLEEEKLNISYMEPDELLKKADIISLHIPGVPETYHFIDENRLALMKPSAILINVARGSVVDQTALTKALFEHKIAGAGLDTYEIEPLPMDSPLLKLDNFVGTPHEGAGSCDTFSYILEHYTIADITRMEKGEEVQHRVV